jgi:hypothetical protein
MIFFKGVYAIDFDNQPFLLYDSRDTDPAEAVFFIFATQKGLERLRKYRNWAGDGTFSIVPPNLLQLYSICVIIQERHVIFLQILFSSQKNIFQILNQFLALEISKFCFLKLM